MDRARALLYRIHSARLTTTLKTKSLFVLFTLSDNWDKSLFFREFFFFLGKPVGTILHKKNITAVAYQINTSEQTGIRIWLHMKRKLLMRKERECVSHVVKLKDPGLISNMISLLIGFPLHMMTHKVIRVLLKQLPNEDDFIVDLPLNTYRRFWIGDGLPQN